MCVCMCLYICAYTSSYSSDAFDAVVIHYHIHKCVQSTHKLYLCMYMYVFVYIYINCASVCVYTSAPFCACLLLSVLPEAAPPAVLDEGDRPMVVKLGAGRDEPAPWRRG